MRTPEAIPRSAHACTIVLRIIRHGGAPPAAAQLVKRVSCPARVAAVPASEHVGARPAATPEVIARCRVVAMGACPLTSTEARNQPLVISLGFVPAWVTSGAVGASTHRHAAAETATTAMRSKELIDHGEEEIARPAVCAMLSNSLSSFPILAGVRLITMSDLLG